MARFFHPVFATKNTDKVVENRTVDDGEDIENVITKAFQWFYVSFQSTSLCNISTVNALNYCKISDMSRERGKFDNTRCWGIDMNEVRQLYLGNYLFIDSIDHLIKNSA